MAPDAGTPDPGLEVEVRSWLELAALDLEAAVRLAGDPDFARVVVYHCQQAAEMAIKGLLTWNGIRFGRTHDLDMLGSLARPLAPALGPVLDRAVDLTPYAWLYRYPPDSPAPLQGEAGEAIDAARELSEAILGTVPDGLRPR
ncbi:MAG TPA: HEPN domain-containing protein [Patescibacteria group bacterium]|nr:HEPN domain-containing protein [Patescibacteria group bacterium]